MISSMTGFGIAKSGNLIVQISSLNNKFLDVVFKDSQQFFIYHSSIIQEIKDRISRGSIEINISTTKCGLENHKKIKKYVRTLKLIASDFNISGSLTIRDLLALIDMQEKSMKPIKWQTIKMTIKLALDNLIKCRLNEGRKTEQDLRHIMKNSDEIVKRIVKVLPKIGEELFIRFQERIKKLINDKLADEPRIITEAGVLAARADINEEIKRLQFHFEETKKLFASSEPIGKRLEFLLQEALREINSISSKISFSPIVRDVINLKDNIEKMREQVRNIE